MFDNDCTNVISVYDIGYKPLKSYYLNKDGFLKGVFNDEAPNMRRQDLPTAYMPNGAIYIISTEVFLKEGKLITNKSLPYVMDEEKSFDVDNIQDIKNIEKVLAMENNSIYDNK
jgi:CMP-N-acetylneuraminic acid synthetase